MSETQKAPIEVDVIKCVHVMFVEGGKSFLYYIL
jgi:hypothetical protein